MSNLDLDAIEARANVATEAEEWALAQNLGGLCVGFSMEASRKGYIAGWNSARADIPALIAEVRRLQGELLDSVEQHMELADLRAENARLRALTAVLDKL